ncbi:hypothetical protein M0R72_06855 [Candidatus Pacearchaeota archaeon]|jgi:hypothetical protein|nr:hypothetical protein [Candidatus Pacearchaeota archaeon]
MCCGGSGGSKSGGGGGGNTIQENISSGSLQRSQVIEAVKLMQAQANEAKSKGDYATAKDLMFKASDLATAAKIKPHELLGKSNAPQRAAVIQPRRVTQNTRNDPFAGDPLHDALPRGYGIRSPAEATKYAKANPMPKKQSQKEFDKEYEKRVGRKWDPTLF